MSENDEPNEERPKDVSRKTFVRLSSVGLATSAALAACTPNTAQPTAGTSPASGGVATAYLFFVGLEQPFIEAAVERLIPTDENGPGARDAGVPFFIDRQLDGQFGYAAKMYMQGPWGVGTPEQGYQLPLNPREVYRLGIADTNRYCQRTYGGKSFDGLTADQQDATLTALQKSTAKLSDVPDAVFFQMLYDNTIEGFFADPAYGGNRDMVGWKLLGFPGVAAYYRPTIPNYINKPYAVAPVSLAAAEAPVPMSSTAPEPTGTAATHTTLRHLAMRRPARNGMS